MRDAIWYAAFSNLYPLNFAELVFSLLCTNSVDREAPLGVINQTKILASLFYGDDVHKPSRIRRIGPNFAIDLEESLHQNRSGLTIIKGILQTGEYVNWWTWVNDGRGVKNRLRRKMIMGRQSRFL